MARSTRTAQVVTSAGLTEAFTAADAAGEQMAYNGRRALHVKNGNAGVCNVTISNPVLIDGQAAPNRVVAVPATTGDKIIGLQNSVYLQADGNVYVDYSLTATVTVALIEI